MESGGIFESMQTLDSSGRSSSVNRRGAFPRGQIDAEFEVYLECSLRHQAATLFSLWALLGLATRKAVAMGFGPTLVGGVAGAVAGIVVQVLLEVAAHIQAPWCAVIIGLLTGLGVRKATIARHPGASYLRGAISGLLALGAVLAAPKAIEAVMAKRSAALDLNKKVASASDGEVEDAPKSSGGGEAAPVETPMESREGAGSLISQKIRQGPERNDMWQFIYMAVGAFLAYEFGRGSDAKPAASNEGAGQPTMTDPSN